MSIKQLLGRPPHLAAARCSCCSPPAQTRNIMAVRGGLRGWGRCGLTYVDPERAASQALRAPHPVRRASAAAAPEAGDAEDLLAQTPARAPTSGPAPTCLVLGLTLTEQHWPVAPQGSLATLGPLPPGAKVHRCTLTSRKCLATMSVRRWRSLTAARARHASARCAAGSSAAVQHQLAWGVVQGSLCTHRLHGLF